MFIFKAKGLAKDWDGISILKNIDLDISSGEHLALFGRNGTGKTTLLEILLDRTPYDQGTLHRFLPLEKWGYLDQHPQVADTVAAIDFVMSADRVRFQLKGRLARLEQQYQKEKSGAVWAEYGDIYDQFLQQDGFSLEVEAEKALREVGLSSSAWHVPFEQLSGGQKTKTQFAHMIMKRPEFIILDEPTNHLDGETLRWLETWLNRFTGAALFVSHDRYFLDQTAHAIIELSEEGTKRYPGGYTSYREQKEVERRTQEALYKKQEQKKKALLETIDRYQKWFHVAHAAAGNDHFLKAKAKKNVSRFHAKEKELERLENEQVQKWKEPRRADMRLNASGTAAKTIVRLENVTFGYEEAALFTNLNMTIRRDDRVALIGPNGSGKSTLLKLIVGELKGSGGTALLLPRAKIGYFAQELDHLPDDQTILDSLLVLPNMSQTEARTILGSFLFTREDVFKRIGDLSMGERCRVAFLRLYFSDANILVLDEPTNYLDVDTREVVEDVLQAYPGALLVVSHDRYFVRKLANRIVKIEDGKVLDYPGTFDEFEAHEKRGPRDTQAQAKENEIAQLELKLTQLLTTDGVQMTDENQASLLQEIKDIKRKIEEVKAR